MSKLPGPSWLTLSETIAWLAERKISEVEAKSNLPRAFRDGHIDTRGRSREYTGHDIQAALQGINWDRANINWEDSSFEIPSSRSTWSHRITDVAVARDDLSRWIGEGEEGGSKTVPVKKTGGRKLKYPWDEFYVEIAVRADLDNLPETQAELEKDMATWCSETWEKKPAESTIREKISPIYLHPRRLQGR